MEKPKYRPSQQGELELGTKEVLRLRDELERIMRELVVSDSNAMLWIEKAIHKVKIERCVKTAEARH